MVKHLPTMWEIRVQYLIQEDPLEKEMATHSSTLAGKSHEWRSMVDYSPWGHKESDTTEHYSNRRTVSIQPFHMFCKSHLLYQFPLPLKYSQQHLTKDVVFSNFKNISRLCSFSDILYKATSKTKEYFNLHKYQCSLT